MPTDPALSEASPPTEKTSPLSTMPSWLRKPLHHTQKKFMTEKVLEKYQLNTVCEEARCPNRGECFSKKTATFLALGKACSRNCAFCDIDFTKTPPPPDPEEPYKIASSIMELGLKHAVVTMVARDDLPDGGAQHIANIIYAIRHMTPNTTIEVLTSDFSGNPNSLDLVLDAQPDIFNHNIETVQRLSPSIRHKATFPRTLAVLAHAKHSKKTQFVKSGLMVGLGELAEEVYHTIMALHKSGTDIITIGQYLRPSKGKFQVKEYIPPQLFTTYREYGHSLGIRHMYCGPFVRSSYNAAEVMDFIKNS